MAELISPDVKFHHSKLNLKGGRVERPSSGIRTPPSIRTPTTSVLAVGLLLDDATAKNDASVVFRKPSRKSPRSADDGGKTFIGRMREEDIRRFDARKGNCSNCPLGSIHIHHYRLIHWSAPNTSADDRRLLINAYSAADAIPLQRRPDQNAIFRRNSSRPRAA